MFKIIIFLNLFFLLLHSESIYSNDNCTVADAGAANKVLSFLNDNSVQLSFFSSIKSDAYKQKFVELFEDMARHNKLDEFKDLIFQEKSLKVKQYFDTIVELENKADLDKIDNLFATKISTCKSGTFNPSDCKRFFGSNLQIDGGRCTGGLYICIKRSLEKINQEKMSDPQLRDDKFFDYFIDRELDRFLIKARNENKFDTVVPSLLDRYKNAKNEIRNFDPSDKKWLRNDKYDSNKGVRQSAIDSGHEFASDRSSDIRVGGGKFDNKSKNGSTLLPVSSDKTSHYKEYDLGILDNTENRGAMRVLYNPQNKTVWVTGDHYMSARFIGCKPSDCNQATIDTLRRQCRSRQLRCEVP